MAAPAVPAQFDTSKPLDMVLLTQAVTAAQDPRTPKAARDKAQGMLTALMQDPSAWRHVDTILESSTNPVVKFFGMQILEHAIKFRWQTLPKDQREGVRNYVVSKIIALSSNADTARSQRMYIAKLNLNLVQVLKQEWPHNWPTFIPEIVASSKRSELLCANNISILRLLSEEVFDFGKNEMTSAKIAHLKTTLNSQFAQIFQLCDYVLRMSSDKQLLTATLQCLLRFMSWIPLGYIFRTKLVEQLVMKFFASPVYRTDALQCLSEIAALDIENNAEYARVVEQMYVGTMNILVRHIPMSANIKAGYKAGREEEKLLIQRLSLFFTNFFRNHLRRVETAALQRAMSAGMTYLVKISDVDDPEIFKICLDYWHHLAHDLYTTECRAPSKDAASVLSTASASSTPSRKALYAPLLTQVRLVMISHMVKPEEVLIKEDESGDIVRTTIPDSDALAQYKTMRETLVYLTHLDYDDTEVIMLTKLSRQVDGSEWSWTRLNTLCWAIGSISGAMSEKSEKRFVVTVIKDLLGLCERKNGKKNKAVVASNIMYVVGQYPRFLRAHWRFLKTVVLKLFEFMHEKHPGVQDMACDTFLKIAQKLKRKFVMRQPGETASFVEELCDMLPATIVDLEIHQIHAFYEAAGHMVSAHPDPAQRALLLDRVMALPNQMWQRIMGLAATNLNELKKDDTVREVQRILRTNVRICTSVGPSFIKQMGRMYLDMLNVYIAYSEHISGVVAKGGAGAVHVTQVQLMMTAKRETLALITAFVRKADNSDCKVIATSFIPPLFDAVLKDYKRCIPVAREAEVLALMRELVLKLKGLMAPHIAAILESVFECTLAMITPNMTDYPDVRLQFFKMLQAINQRCFAALFAIAPSHQKFVVHSIVWAFRHQERTICETGLTTLQTLLVNVAAAPGKGQQAFYQQYFVSLLQDVLWVLTDRLHKFAFKQHVQILHHMFQLVESGQIKAPLFPSTVTGKTNKMFVGEHVCKLLLSYFKNLTSPQVMAFVTGLFDMTKSVVDYKTHIRDFLIELREFKSGDNSDLYSEEAAAAAKAAADAERARMLAVPGLIAGAHDTMDDI